MPRAVPALTTLAGSALVVMATAGCPGQPGNGALVPPPLPDPKADDASITLEPIPATVDAQRVEPSEGNDPSARSPLLDIMAAENKRWMHELARAPDPAYYLAYQVYDQRTVIIEAQGGALVTREDDTTRFLDVEVRVGSPLLDNRRSLSNEQANQINAPLFRRGVVPFGADPVALKNHLWIETDRRFREAEIALRVVRTDKRVTAQSKEIPPDFVHVPAASFIQAPGALDVAIAAFEQRARDCSKRSFRGVATRANCRFDFAQTTVYFVNSEGTQLQMSWPTSRVSVSVGVKAPDGMPLGRLEQRFANAPGELPDDAEIDRMIATVTADLDALHEAPVVDPYEGPAILEGRAAGVFFHEVFGHRIEGHRQKERTSGQTFSSKVGERIMPEWITVYDDPTMATLNGIALNGFYRYDDEGVRAQKAVLVDDGVLAGFVMGRNPIEGFLDSNGHGRKEPGRTPVSRQGNLVVEVERSVTKAELDDALIAEVKRRGKPFGMVFTDISGGFTNTSRFLPQAFKVNPVMAYRVYPSGKRELVRGVDIVGTPLTALGNIIGSSREIETFNGMCGAESGWVPVSASAPSLLLSSLEVERGWTAVDRPPVLPPPSIQRHDRAGSSAPAGGSR